MKKHIITLSLLLLITACTSTPQIIGFAEQDVIYFSSLEEQKDDKNKVLELLGEPSIISDFIPNKWYYISFINEKTSFSNSNIKNFHMLELLFDDKDKILSKKVYTMKDLNKFHYNKNITPTKEIEDNYFINLFNNLGSVNPMGINNSRRR